MTEKLKLLAVFPHPDDETLGVGPTLAHYAAGGVDVYLLCLTRGEGGWTGPADQNPGPRALGDLREAELRCAAEQLGLCEVTLLDYIDGTVDQADPPQVINQLVAYIRKVRPQVVLTYAPDGVYGHPDHIAVTQFTSAALVCAADHAYQDADEQPPHRAAKFYHMVLTPGMVDLWHRHVGPLTMPVDGVERGFNHWPDWAITTRIDARAALDRFMAALACHRSQVPGFAPLLVLPRATLETMYGEGRFVRIYSLVNGGRQPETDLFHGLR